MKNIDLNLLKKSQKKRIDSFFIHQCIIRRFRYNYPDDYNKLLGIRDDIESILSLAEISAVTKNEFEISSIELALASMNFLENIAYRNLLNSNISGNTRTVFYNHLNSSIVGIRTIEEYLPEKIIDDILNILMKNICTYNELVRKYNIFDYYSIFSMTVCVNFYDFYKLYFDSRNGKTKTNPFFINTDSQANFLYSNEIDIDNNIYISIKSNCCNSYFYSSNINVLYDDENDIVINGEKSQNSIYLKVSVDETPNNIDAAIEFYKNSIIELLVNNYGFIGNLENNGFTESNFYKLYNTNTFLITDWNRICNNILGLWCLDIFKNEKLTVDNAADKVSLQTNRAYQEESIKKYYDRIAKIISITNEKADGKNLDNFVTGCKNTILGLRVN